MKRPIVLLLALCLALLCCGAAPAPRESEQTRMEVPPMATSAFHPERAENSGKVSVDLSAVSEGYVALCAYSNSRLKAQVLKDEMTYTYDISSEGVPSILPLQCGSGRYTIRVLENVGSTKYAVIYVTERNVKLLDEFQPFLRPNDYARYDASSLCVQSASHIAAHSRDALEFIGGVYELICGSIAYDAVKASSTTTMYLPDVDATLISGKGICFDYASLAAAMLRSQGVPTKIIFGYVAPNDLYHAWNMFYTKEKGWITVSFEVGDDTWNRIDLTCSAGGASDEFIGDGSHYTAVYYF